MWFYIILRILSTETKNLNTLRYTRRCTQDSLFEYIKMGLTLALKNVKTNVWLKALEERSDRQTSVFIGA